MPTSKLGRIAGFAAAAAAIASMTIGPAAASTPDANGEHKVTICHVNNSAAGEPYVVIEVDVAAFDGADANDHTHHVAKDGRHDVLYDPIWGCGGSTNT